MHTEDGIATFWSGSLVSHCIHHVCDLCHAKIWLKGVDTLSCFSAVLKGRQLGISCVLLCAPALLKMERICSKVGSKFFPYKVEPFSEGEQKQF